MNLEFDEESYHKIVAIQEERKLRKREDVIRLLLEDWIKNQK
jgi:hypothetical protein